MDRLPVEVAVGPDGLEREIARIWEEILGVPAIARSDDFFEIGGTSLHVARVVTKTRAAFGVKLSARTLYECPTLGAFTAAVRAALGPEATAE